MVRTLAVGLLLCCAMLVGLVDAQTTGFKLGDSAPPFKDLPGVDGKKYSSGDFKQDTLVMIITCNQCPVAIAYEERIVNFTKKHANGQDAKVGVVAFNVSSKPENNLDSMKVRAKEKNFTFPYLFDATQRIAKELNAHVTPEFYVFNKERKLVYWGAMDDDMLEDKIKQRYLEPAIDAVLAGKAVPTAMTKAFGCTVEYIK